MEHVTTGIEKSIGKNIKQAEAVHQLAHLYGTRAKVDEIKAICEEYKVRLIEAAAEAGATYKGVQTGRFGGRWQDLHSIGNKIITTSGGGMIASDSDQEEYIKHGDISGNTGKRTGPTLRT